MKEARIVLHRFDDWEYLYINGKLEQDNTSETLETWLTFCVEFPIKILSLETHYHSDRDFNEYIENNGVPEKLEDFQKLTRRFEE